MSNNITGTLEQKKLTVEPRLKACRPSCGAVLVPTGQMAHNQVLLGKYNTKVVSRASSGPVRPGTTDHTDIPKTVYGIRRVPVYIIEFPK